MFIRFIINKCNIYLSAYSAIVLSTVRWLIHRRLGGGGVGWGATTRDIYCCDSITAITILLRQFHEYCVISVMTLRCTCYMLPSHISNITTSMITMFVYEQRYSHIIVMLISPIDSSGNYRQTIADSMM